MVSSYCIGWPGSPGVLSETVDLTVNLPPPFDMPVIGLRAAASLNVDANCILSAASVPPAMAK